MDGEAVRKIAELAIETMDPGDALVATDFGQKSLRQLYDVKPRTEPDPGTLIVSTLLSFCRYLLHDIDEQYLDGKDGPYIHVSSARRVELVTHIFGDMNQRVCTVCADHSPDIFPFGRFIGSEEMVIALQTLFGETEDRDRLLRIVGNLREEAVTEASDDGFTQEVTVRQGVTRAGNVDVSNPFVLAPFRTFPEVPQPTSPFIARFQGGGQGNEPKVALFECDGGRWEVDARSIIADHIRTDLGPMGDHIVILA